MSLFKNSSVKELTSKNFTGKKLNVKNPEGSMVIFYADWCGHCKMLAPELKKFSKTMGDRVKVFAIESKNEDLMKTFKVTGFPTIKYVRKDGVLIKADDFGRTIQEMMDFMCKKTSMCKYVPASFKA